MSVLTKIPNHYACTSSDLTFSTLRITNERFIFESWLFRMSTFVVPFQIFSAFVF